MYWYICMYCGPASRGKRGIVEVGPANVAVFIIDAVGDSTVVL